MTENKTASEMVVLLMPLGPPPPPPLLRISLGWVGSIFWRRTVDQPMTGAGGNGQRQYSLWATSLSPVVSISRPLFNRTHVLLPNKTPPNFVACPETPSQNCRKRQSTHRRVGQCPKVCHSGALRHGFQTACGRDASSEIEAEEERERGRTHHLA